MKNKLAYFVTKSSMFGVGFFLLCNLNNKNTYISIILGTLLGLAIIYLYKLLKKYTINNNLQKTLKSTSIGKIFNILLFIFYIYLLCITILIITTFINSFYLIKTPKIVIILPLLLISLYLNFKESIVLSNLSNLAFYFSLFIVIIFSLLLIPYGKIDELYPFLNYDNLNIIKGSIIYASISSIPLILVNNYDTDIKNTYKNYLIGSLVNLSIVIGTTLALGNNLLNVYRFPEYAVIKQIKIFDFIENIENMSAFGWYAESFIVISLIIYNIKLSIPPKHNKLFLTSITSMVTIISIILFGNNYDLLLKLFYIHPYILISYFIIFIIMLCYLKVKKNTNN